MGRIICHGAITSGRPWIELVAAVHHLRILSCLVGKKPEEFGFLLSKQPVNFAIFAIFWIVVACYITRQCGGGLAR